MKSFSLIKTNVGLTTNVKIVVSSNYQLYLDSIESDPILSSSDYKKFQFNKSKYYDDLLSGFYKGLPTDISYKVKYDDDNNIMYNTFEHQFDDIYQMGCRDIIDNKDYNESYECFAPLYIGSDSFPTNFIVFRIDGPGLTKLNKDNFRNEIINNLKCVSVFDLSRNTPIGEWLETSFTKNNDFPLTPFYMDYRSLEFSSWNGIDYDSGGYISRSMFMDSVLENENTFYDFEKLIYDGYKNNRIVFPNILNLSFLFDDTPATPDELRKWSLNRYMGFYIDSLEKVKSFSPYKLPSLREDIHIHSNVIGSTAFGDPFVNGYDNVSPYIEIDGSFFKVERYTRNSTVGFQKSKISNTAYSDELEQSVSTFYKIISDIDFSGLTYSSFNQNLIGFSKDQDSGKYYIYSGGDINKFPIISNEVLSDADVWLLKVNDKFHVIRNYDSTNSIGYTYSSYIQSDYGFSLDENAFEYWINNIDSNYRTKVSVKFDTSITELISFDLYKCKFTDIKDFDNKIVDTKFTDYEYQMPNEITNTDEGKLYTIDYSSKTNPKHYNDYFINGVVANIPCASEYTANGELFRIIDNDLNDLWRKNPNTVKWGYQNSISSNDYPYLLNNSFLSEDFNRTVNPFDPTPSRKERNLDYFYSVSPSGPSYSYYSLHVQEDFDFSLYSSTQSDYFNYFFSKPQSFDGGNIIKNTEKYSIYEKGDNITPNSTLFRGLKFELYDVDDFKLSNGQIDTINLSSSNKYQGYKFSILLTASQSSLQWKIIDKWKHDELYNTGDIVSYYDILFVSLTQSSIIDPNYNPFASGDWGLTTSSVLWNPLQFYNQGDYVYNNGEYYYKNGSTSSIEFWFPAKTYDIDDSVLFENSVWTSTTASNTYQPGSSAIWRDSNKNAISYWVKSTSSAAWNIIEIWSSNYIYYGGTSSAGIDKGGSVFNSTPGSPYVLLDNVLYKLIESITSSSNQNPKVSGEWIKVYSLIQDTEFPVSEGNIISLNNSYYICTSNTNNEKLNSGISVYVNNIFQNVLIDINISDNTLPNLTNSNRDALYTDIYSVITANNLTNSLSDISTKHGFSSYLNYSIINSSGISRYTFADNIVNIPCLLKIQSPDQLSSRNGSLIKAANTIQSSQFKAKRQLDNSKITTIDTLNYYNGNPLGVEIETKKEDPKLIDNFSGLTNNIYNIMWRYSGYYCPIFYTISLFSTGNYVFNTEVSDFGMVKERIISKVNRRDNILKFKSKPDIRSIYPMIDEFGYTFVDYFIFKSTWDFEYYIECLDITQSENIKILTNKIIR